MGVFPTSFTAFFDQSVAQLIAQHAAAIAATRQMAGL
jgi:hypothetical protein